MDLNECRTFFKKDRYADAAGIVIDEIGENYAQCSMKLEKMHNNAAGSVQGGAIFTLGDFAFAVAANHEGVITVSLNNSITFLKSPMGNVLKAAAVMISKTYRTCCYDVLFQDEEDNLIAKMLVTGFITHKSFEISE